MKNDCLFCAIAAGEIPSNKVYENAENSAVVAHIFEVIAKVTKEMGIESYRVVSNIGEQAGQSVPHLHFHVLAGRDMTWPPG